MNARVVNLLAKLRSSMWFIPAVMATLAGALAIAVGVGQTRVPVPPNIERFLFSGDAAGARAILTSIAGSMIGVTGVVFSITIVALTLASGQFGPRLLRNFMRDRVVQSVLGTFIATFVYCLLALRSVRDVDGAEGAYLSVVFAVVFAIASIGVLIYFIHHIASSIQADSVIARVAAEITAMIEELYPTSVGEPAEPSDTPTLPPDFDERSVGVLALRSGYIQAFDTEELLAAAREHDLIIALDRRPGHFVVVGDVVMRAWPTERFEKVAAKEIAKATILGPRRTAEADIEFLIEQLVEIATRALSPGINDPFTATACIDRLAAALVELSRRDFPSRWRHDEQGNLRIIVDVSSYERILAAAFHQIRQYGRDAPGVVIRILEALTRICEANVDEPTRLAAALDQAERTMRSSRLADHEERDMREIEECYARLQKAAAPRPDAT